MTIPHLTKPNKAVTKSLEAASLRLKIAAPLSHRFEPVIYDHPSSSLEAFGELQKDENLKAICTEFHACFTTAPAGVKFGGFLLQAEYVKVVV
jgi:hypothetical protein